MLMFICAFLPPVIAVMLFEKITKANMRMKDCVYMYTLCTVIVNLFSWGVLRYREGMYLVEAIASETLIKYLLLTLCASVVFGAFTALLKKTVKVRVEENEEKY